MRVLLPAAALLLPVLSSGFAPTAASGPPVTWEPDLAAAFDRARDEDKVVFLAVNMDGEQANERAVKKVYTDRKVVELSALTVNLMASRFDHGVPTKTCKRFGSVTCEQHKRVDMRAREKILKPDPDGWVVAPQHVFLRPDGTVILSVPYEVSARQLAWCFHTALATHDPSYTGVPKGSPPQRLIYGGVYDPGGEGVRVLTREQVLAEIKGIRSGKYRPAQRVEREQAVRSILMSSEPEALEFIEQELKLEFVGGRRGAGNDGEDRPDRRLALLHGIGVSSPQPYWELVAPYLFDKKPELRNEAAVALEQLAVPKSMKTVLKALGKEKDRTIEKNLLRALGTTVADDARGRKKLLDRARKEKDGLLVANALVALGSVPPGDDVRDVLRSAFESGAADASRAAVCAMAISRDRSWVEYLEATAKGAGGDDLSLAVEAALVVLRGENLSHLRPIVRSAASDRIERERIFGDA
jgi:hypothetical protein